MLNILYINGTIDTEYSLDPALLEKDSLSFQQDATVAALNAGKLITVGANGFVKLCDGASEIALGTLVNDAAGYGFENIPALASGKTPALQGGGTVETDQVVEDDIVPGTKLYCNDAGMFTKVDPTGTEATDAGSAQVVGIARRANSTADKTLLVQLYV